MKKLMIAAASAAMIGGAFAGDVAQVYDFTATVKTTACSGKSAKDVCGNTVYYRQQITQKLYGKFWGCACEVIACPDKYAIDAAGENGFVFWTTTKSGGAFDDATMAWNLLQRLGKKGENVEGYFELTLNDGTNDVAWLSGAGYGTAKIDCADEENNYIKSMSGNIVGTWDASADVIATGCYYCGNVSQCEVFAFCSCVAENNDLAAVFGTFTLKYNASQTKSVNAGKSITEIAFKKNTAVLEVLNAVDPTPEPEDAVTKLKRQYAEAKALFDDLNLGAENCSSGLVLKASVDAKTQAAANAATAASDAEAEITAITGANSGYEGYSEAVSTYKAKVVALATAKNTSTSSSANIAAAQQAVTDAYNALPQGIATTVAEKVAAWQTAEADKATAATAQTAAEDALAAWKVAVTGGWAVAKAAAESDLANIKIACLIAGADCE